MRKLLTSLVTAGAIALGASGIAYGEERSNPLRAVGEVAATPFVRLGQQLIEQIGRAHV